MGGGVAEEHTQGARRRRRFGSADAVALEAVLVAVRSSERGAAASYADCWRAMRRCGAIRSRNRGLDDRDFYARPYWLQQLG